MQQRFLLQILLLAQHVSGITMSIIRSSRVLYSGCCLWYFVLWFLNCWSGMELRVMCPVCRMLQHPANQTHRINCGNKMPTRCNRGFYCRSYCLLNMFRATTMPIIRSSRVLYSGCCLWYFVLWFSSCWSGVELRVMCPVFRMQLPETCWASNNICNKKPLLHLVGILFPHINDDIRLKSHQNK